jgi:phosphohistidine phosphatase
MDVLIVRHAVAFNRDPMQWPDDRDRPLRPDGERKFKREARALAKLVPDVDLLLSSPWKRAWQTAEILNEDAGWPSPQTCEALEGDRSPRGVLGVLRDHPRAKTVALVGHEPQTSRLASYMLTGDAERLRTEFKKGGVALLTLEGPLRAGTAVMLWSIPPRVLRSLG